MGNYPDRCGYCDELHPNCTCSPVATTSPTQRAGADVLCEVEAYFADREDVNDGDYGVPEPNEAMNLLRDVREAQATIAALQARIAELEADNERLRGAFDDADEQASVHWYGRWVDVIRLLRDIRPALACQDTLNPCADLRKRIDAAIDAHAQGQAGEEKDG